MKFTDSHCHIDFPEFKEELAPLLNQCQQNGIVNIIVPAVCPSQWQHLLDTCLCPDNPIKLWPCLGLHPWYLKELTEQHLNLLSHQVKQHHPQLIAIGETGLDGVIAKEQDNWQQQQMFFEYQLNLANEHQLPVIIHHRRSHQQIIETLKKIPVNRGGVIHAFSGSYQQGKTYIDMGFKLGIGGTISYPRAEKTIKAVKRLPLDALLLETDAPAMPLYGAQGSTNSPLQLTRVFDYLCAIRTESKEHIAEIIEENVKQVFKLDY